MSGESVDKSESLRSSRRRRALRVPIADIPHASALDDSVEAGGNGAVADLSNVVELDAASSVTAALDFIQDRDPTEPTFMTEPDPLGGEGDVDIEPDDLSDPGIEVHFSDAPPEHPSPKTPSATGARVARR